jgi:tRNA (guanine37-N1)-methyltransferase
MLAAFTNLKNAEKVKKFLVEKKLINRQYRAMKELDHIYYPITKKIKVPHAKVVNTKFKFEMKGKKITIESLLKSKLTLTELSRIPKSQEIVGDIMILEVPESLYQKEKIIAEAYLELNKNITTVVKKTKMHSGVFRTRKVKILAGKRTKETIHQESGIRIKLHLEKTYFSARSANERLRIAKQVKKGEEILVMFSGAAPFPLVIAKNSPAKIIYGVELNPEASRFATESVALNKLVSKIKLYNGNVITVLPKIKKKFDRIAMPLPKTGEEFLYLALKKIKPKGIIHLYAFLHETEIAKEAKRISAVCKQLKSLVRILRKVKCGQFSPGTYRVCFDIRKI